MRLRYKNGVSPGRIYFDHQLIPVVGEMYVEPLNGQYISVFSILYNLYDVFVISLILHILLGPESKKDEEQRQVYVIRWRPSQCSVDPIEEIILDKDMFFDDPKHVIEKV